MTQQKATTKPITVNDLRDQTGITGPREFLYCSICGEHYSANKGDYYFIIHPKPQPFKCCGQNMRLMTATKQLKEFRP